MTYEIHYDSTAGVYEAFAVHADGTREWLAACDTRWQAQAWCDRHKAESAR